MDDFEYLSFFSGAMGFDIGIEKSGFKCVFANEINKDACDTILKNRPQISLSSESIVDLSAEKIEKMLNKSLANIPLIVGGPPCQAFSVIGKRKGLSDTRGMMIYEFIRMVDEIKPECFIMENVRGLHSMPLATGKANGTLFKEILQRFEAIGYHVDCFIVNAVNYGVSQIRERMICIGNRYDLIADFPSPQFSNRQSDNLPPFKTLGDVIGEGFDDNDPSLMNFSPRKLHYLSYVPEGGNWRNMPVDVQKESMGKSWYLKGGRSAYWRRLSFDFPSPTVVTMPNHASTSLCHPKEIRALTVGECAAVQGFPKDWEFCGKISEKYKQIGNAVPPRLGEIAGQTVMKLLREIKEKELKPTSPSHSNITHLRPHVRTRTYWKNGKIAQSEESYYSHSNVQGSLLDVK